MSLPPAAARAPLHRREIVIEGFARDDGHYDIEASLTDTKTHEFSTDRQLLPPGRVLHGLQARMTVSPQFEIVDFEVAMNDTPSVACETAPPFFKALIGLKIVSGFLKEANARVGGTLGCTHIREMLQQMGTVAFQTIMAQRKGSIRGEPDKPPLLINSCHGWRDDGALIERNYPRFYKG